MSRQELIDKAIDDLKLAADDPFFGKEFLCRTKLTDGRFTYYSTDYCHPADIDLVCAKHEFQARKAEREDLRRNIDILNKARGLLDLEKTPITEQHQLDAIAEKVFEIKFRDELDELIATTNHWYDYKNQKALRLPPAGEVVEFKSKNKDWFVGAKVVFVTEYVIVLDGDAGANETAQVAYNYGEHPEFRPLDWSKHRIAAVNELTDLIKAEGVEGITAVSCADSILAAGYRKCDN